MSRQKKPLRLNAVLYAMLIEDMVSGPASRPELMESTGLSRKTVESVVGALHKKRLIYISGWDLTAAGRRNLAMFSFGGKPDVPKPPAITPTECKRRQRAKRAAADPFGVRKAANDSTAREAA